jgi:ankyrin repeat protein
MEDAMLPIRKVFALIVLNIALPILSYYEPKTALMCAAEKGDVKRMQKLIKEGADVNAVYERDQPRMGYPVLRFAIDSKSIPAVELLLKHGANPNEHTTSPIMHRKRPSANVRNLPLLSHAIASHAPYRIVKLLIDYGADTNQKTVFNEWTPLMVAAYATNLNAVELLLKTGANCKSINCCDGNRTAYDYAKEHIKSYITAYDEEKRIDNREIMRILHWCMRPPTMKK